MSQHRLQKLNNKHLSVNKTYPEYISKDVIVDYEAINPIDFESIKNDVTKLKISNGRKSPPAIYKNNKTNQYYIKYTYGVSKFNKCLFDITDDYDWDKVLEHNLLKSEFRKKESIHIKSIIEKKLYYPGSPEYDAIYPPVKSEV